MLFYRSQLCKANILFGGESQKQLTENIGGASINLSANDIKNIDDAFAKTNVQGDRYPAHLQSRVGK